MVPRLRPERMQPRILSCGVASSRLCRHSVQGLPYIVKLRFLPQSTRRAATCRRRGVWDSMATSDISTLAASLQAPIPQWHEAESAGHVVQFYSNDSFLFEALSRYVGTALGAGDSAVVIATQNHVDGLNQRLRSRGLDIARFVRSGHYFVLDAAETLAKFMHHGQPVPELFVKTVGDVVARASSAAEGKTPRVAAFGE